MITDLKVGDYIEKSELDTEQKYNDVVEVFEQWGFSRNGEHALSYCNFMNHERENALVASNLVDFGCHLIGCNLDSKKTQRKLTYNDIMSLKKVDVDNCNIDKVVSGGVIKPYDPRAILSSCKDKELESLSRFVTGDDIDWSKAPVSAEFYIGENESGIAGFGYLRDENLDGGGRVCAVIGSDCMLNFDALLDAGCIHCEPKSNDENTGPFAEPETTEKINIKEMIKSAKAVLAMESLGHEWDKEKGQWFRKEYF